MKEAAAAHALLSAHASKVSDAHEAEMVRLTQAFIVAEPTCLWRHCVAGHLTGSAWIVDPTRTRTLLTHHRKLDKWLQLGGHADGDPDLRAVARREAEEESGLDGFQFVSEALFDVDRHWIPARKSDPGHWHFDFRFMLAMDPKRPLTLSDESHDLAWVPLAEMATYNAEESMMRMVRKTLGG